MTLNDVWFFLFVLIIAGYLILDGFDLGVGMLHLFVARSDEERRISLNSIGPIWDGNEVWLVLGGGALFAAFPVVYASLFSGFYVAMMLVLLFLILRTVAIEFRSKRPGPGLAWTLGFHLLSLLAGHRPAAGRRLRQYHCAACRSMPTVRSAPRCWICSILLHSWSASPRSSCWPCTARFTW